MKSSTGQYYQSLDHVRALAAFLVFSWHFNHTGGGEQDLPLMLGLSFLTEGHTGVAIFMTLSGYLFAKLLDGCNVRFGPFLWNRLLRLLPLLVVVLAMVAVERAFYNNLSWSYAVRILKGLVQPNLPNGGWSITVELHFYLFLPVLLALSARSANLLLVVLAVAVAVRTALFLKVGQIQDLAYWTIVGRIDQFLLGIIAFHFRAAICGNAGRALFIVLVFTLLWWGFDLGGGFYGREEYPSSTPLWIIIPTVEGAAYGWLIAWYDDWYASRRKFPTLPLVSRLSAFVALIGTYSYSIYLLHPFFVFRIGKAIDAHLISLDDKPYLTLALSFLAFLLMVPIAHISYRLIELPPMYFRKNYIVTQGTS